MAKDPKKISPEEEAWNKKNQEKVAKATAWDCSLDFQPLDRVHDIDRPQANPEIKPKLLTVGQEFSVSCNGPAVAFNPKELKLSVQSPYATRHMSKLVLQKRTWDVIAEENVNFTAVSYTPGKVSTSFFLEDEENTVFVKQLNFQLEPVTPQPSTAGAKQDSSMDKVMKMFGQKKETGSKQQQVQQPTPYPGYGPVHLAYPQWYWYIFFGVLFVFLVFSFIKIKKHLDLRKLLKNLDEHQTALGAFHQMHKDIRRLEKDYFPPKNKDLDYVKQLDSIFRMFLVRQLKVPALDWSNGQIVSYIEDKFPRLDKRTTNRLKVLLRELQENQSESIQDEDANQLLKVSQKVSESLYNQTKGGNV